MTPEQQQAVADYFADAAEAIDAVGWHAGHHLEQVGRCIYCSCGLRVGQGKLSQVRAVPTAPPRPSGYREAHTSRPRPAGDRTPSGQ